MIPYQKMELSVSLSEEAGGRVQHNQQHEVHLRQQHTRTRRFAEDDEPTGSFNLPSCSSDCFVDVVLTLASSVKSWSPHAPSSSTIVANVFVDSVFAQPFCCGSSFKQVSSWRTASIVSNLSRMSSRLILRCKLCCETGDSDSYLILYLFLSVRQSCHSENQDQITLLQLIFKDRQFTRFD